MVYVYSCRNPECKNFNTEDEKRLSLSEMLESIFHCPECGLELKKVVQPTHRQFSWGSWRVTTEAGRKVK